MRAISRVSWGHLVTLIWLNEQPSLFATTMPLTVVFKRKFSLGNMVKIIAGPFGGDTGYVVTVREDTIAIAIIQENGTSNDVSYYKSLCSILTNCIGRSI